MSAYLRLAGLAVVTRRNHSMPRGPGRSALRRDALDFRPFLGTKAKPDQKEEFDYPSYLARELTRGLQAYGAIDLD